MGKICLAWTMAWSGCAFCTQPLATGLKCGSATTQGHKKREPRTGRASNIHVPPVGSCMYVCMYDREEKEEAVRYTHAASRRVCHGVTLSLSCPVLVFFLLFPPLPFISFLHSLSLLILILSLRHWVIGSFPLFLSFSLSLSLSLSLFPSPTPHHPPPTLSRHPP